MNRRSPATAVVVGLVLATTSCGSSRSSVSTTPASAATTVSAVPSSSTDPVGVPAREVSTDVPFHLVATPSQLKVGDRLVLRAAGDTSAGWQGGVDTNVDLEVGGSWRTLWVIVDEEFKSVIQPIGGGSEATVPATGVAVTSDIAFVIPADLAPRRYRFCRAYHRPDSERRFYVCAFANVVTG
jgi:hypothetical protein